MWGCFVHHAEFKSPISVGCGISNKTSSVCALLCWTKPWDKPDIIAHCNRPIDKRGAEMRLTA